MIAPLYFFLMTKPEVKALREQVKTLIDKLETESNKTATYSDRDAAVNDALDYLSRAARKLHEVWTRSI